MREPQAVCTHSCCLALSLVRSLTRVSLYHSLCLASQGLEQARYATLSTVTEAGFPACRTVVVRDIHEERGVVVTTDTRSNKVAELGHMKATASSLSLASPHIALDPSLAGTPLSELTCWFPLTKEQYRLLGHTQLVSASHPSPALLDLRTRTWQHMSPPSRSQFEMPAPGSRKERSKQGDLDRYEAQHPSVDVVSDNFALLILYPLRADYVYLPKPVVSPHPIAIEVEAGVAADGEGARSEKDQARWQLQWDGAEERWQSVEVNP